MMFYPTELYQTHIVKLMTKNQHERRGKVVTNEANPYLRNCSEPFIVAYKNTEACLN
jgi:hypothetical protein